MGDPTPSPPDVLTAEGVVQLGGRELRPDRRPRGQRHRLLGSAAHQMHPEQGGRAVAPRRATASPSSAHPSSTPPRRRRRAPSRPRPPTRSNGGVAGAEHPYSPVAGRELPSPVHGVGAGSAVSGRTGEGARRDRLARGRRRRSPGSPGLRSACTDRRAPEVVAGRPARRLLLSS